MSHFLKICSAGALLAAASLAAQAADAPAAAASPEAGNVATVAPDAQVVVRDAATGRLRAPTESETQALHAAAPHLRRVPGTPMQRSHHSGAKGVRLTEEFMSYSVVIKQPDGRLVEYCFPNAEAAEAAVTAPVSAPNTLPTE
jgi:hypothetical protein